MMCQCGLSTAVLRCAAGGEMAAETDPSGNFSWHLWVQFFANMVFGYGAK